MHRERLAVGELVDQVSICRVDQLAQLSPTSRSGSEDGRKAVLERLTPHLERRGSKSGPTQPDRKRFGAPVEEPDRNLGQPLEARVAPSGVIGDVDEVVRGIDNLGPVPGSIERLGVERQERVLWQREGLVVLDSQTVASRMTARLGPEARCRNRQDTCPRDLAAPSGLSRHANPCSPTVGPYWQKDSHDH